MSEEQKYTKLNPEFKARWIKSLRSGEYKQGYNYLKIDDKYCCLGVACAVEGIDNFYSKTGHRLETIDNTISTENLNPISGDSSINDAVYRLVSMNDGDWSFAEIADWIEVNL